MTDAAIREAFMQDARPYLDDLLKSARQHLRYYEARGDLTEGSITPEEVAGETLIRACSGREKRPPNVSLRSWLLGLESRVIDQLLTSEQEQQRLWTVSLDEPLPGHPTTEPDRFWSWLQPEEPLRIADGLPALDPAVIEEVTADRGWIRRLEPDEWRAWLLRESHRLKIGEVSAVLRQKLEDTVTTLEDARQQLREWLDSRRAN